jgi:membrane protease YdiL (CAAX protease family)
MVVRRVPAEHIAPKYPWSPSDTFPVLLLTIGVWILCSASFLLYYLVFFGIPLDVSALENPLFLILTMLLNISFLAIPLGFIVGKKAPLKSLGLKTGGMAKLVKDVLCGLGVGIALIPVMLALAFHLIVFDPSFGPPPTPPGPVDIFWLGLLCLTVCLVIAPSEELLFRGFVQNSLDAYYGNLAGLIITSIIFGIAHLNPIVSGVTQAVAGIFLGLLFRWRGRRLAAPISCHAIYNCLMFILDAFFI